MIRTDRSEDAFQPVDHDHRSCVRAAVDRAERLCGERGGRMTPIRRRVLELVWSGHAPRGAYEILQELGRERGRVAPPTVYRALDFLLAQGLIHRIESLNAFIGCAQPAEGHAGQFFICRDCGVTAELSDRRLTAAIDHSAERLGFAVDASVVEVRGRCPGCRESTGQ